MTAKRVEYYVPCNDGSSRLLGYMCNDCGFIAVKKHWSCPYCRAAMENADKVDEWAECYVEHYPTRI